MLLFTGMTLFDMRDLHSVKFVDANFNHINQNTGGYENTPPLPPFRKLDSLEPTLLRN